jgi:Kef-type K+ transport system membrane component KefB
MELTLSSELQYISIFVILILLPKVLLRFRIPIGISSLLIGSVVGTSLGWFQNDLLIDILAKLGITTLFLFAGMEVEVDEIKKDFPTISKFLVKTLILTFICAFAFTKVLDLEFRPSLILAIGVLTPSAGFILNSLKLFQFKPSEEYWIKSQAISKEIIAIFIMFLALQADDLRTFFISKAILLVLIFSLPIIFKIFLKFIAPYAPKTEVSFLILVAFVAGIITKKIGTYYLVGAFISGVVAGQFKHFIESEDSDRILNSVNSFFSIFVPFYFFSSGLKITTDYFTLNGLIIGIALALTIIPIRIGLLIYSIKHFLSEFWEDRHAISISLTPTLIFGLVMMGILREKFNVNTDILSGLIIYTVLASLIPSIVFKKAPPEAFDTSTV